MSAAPPTDAGEGLTTGRLVLRRYAPADLPELLRLNSDPGVMRWLGGPASEIDTHSAYAGFGELAYFRTRSRRRLAAFGADAFAREPLEYRPTAEA